MLAPRLRETNDVIAAENFLPLRGRVALTLMDLGEHFGERVDEGRIVIRHKFGQSDLAAMAGIARENVSRIIVDLTRRKLISRVSGYYCIENKSGLQREIGGADALVLKPERACRSWRGTNMSNLIPTGFIVVTAACAALFSAIAVAMGRL
jgi:hypothetical protein